MTAWSVQGAKFFNESHPEEIAKVIKVLNERGKPFEKAVLKFQVEQFTPSV
jgi:hypothetical protein